ncbi:MAG TPA: hypothetical protein VIO60_00065 [Rectinemataceae bacterium]
MKLKFLFILPLAALLAFSCAPKQAKTEAAPAAPAASAAPAAIVAADIKDPAAWIAAYDQIIKSYSEAAALVNNGNAAAMATADSLAKTAAELDAVAETIKASLIGQAQTDFAAKIQEYKDKFKAASAS